MKINPLIPLTELVDIFDHLREPVSLVERNKRELKYPYYGATGQIGLIDDFKQNGKFILLGEDGAPFLEPNKPKAYIVEGKCWVNNHAHVLKGKVGLCDDDYLCYALNWVDYSNAVTGSTRLKLPQSMMSNLMIPKPSLYEQRQIAAQLKVQFEKVENARKAIEEQRLEIQNLANAIIYQSINERKTNRYNLNKVLNEIKKGIGENWADYPVLGATRNGLALAKEPPGKNPQRYKPVVPGTVFYNPMRILIGSIAFVDDDEIHGITSPDYVVLQGKEGLLDSRWFYYWLRSPLGEKCISSLARGAVRERMLFNRLANGEIELPEYAIQKTASKALKELKYIKMNIEKKMDDISVLPNRLLTQAFNID